MALTTAATPAKRASTPRVSKPRAVFVIYGVGADGKIDVKGLFTKAEDAMVLLNQDRTLDFYRGELPAGRSAA